MVGVAVRECPVVSVKVGIQDLAGEVVQDMGGEVDAEAVEVEALNLR